MQLLVADAIGDGHESVEPKLVFATRVAAVIAVGQVEAELTHARSRERAEHEVLVRGRQLPDRWHGCLAGQCARSRQSIDRGADLVCALDHVYARRAREFTRPSQALGQSLEQEHRAAMLALR